MVITLLPFCSTFHTHLKIVGCFFFSFCLFSWNGIWKVIKSEQVLKASYQFVDTTGHSCSATSLAIIDLEHSFVFVFTLFYFFLPKHCSIQNCSEKERILGYWVAPQVVSERERDLLLISHLYVVVQGNEPNGSCLLCLLLCAQGGGHSSGVKNFHVLGQTSSSVMAIAEELWLVAAYRCRRGLCCLSNCSQKTD